MSYKGFTREQIETGMGLIEKVITPFYSVQVNQMANLRPVDFLDVLMDLLDNPSFEVVLTNKVDTTKTIRMIKINQEAHIDYQISNPSTGGLVALSTLHRIVQIAI